MKQKTIGLNPLEEYLSGKKQSKDQSVSSENSPVVEKTVSVEMKVEAPASKVNQTRDTAQVTQSSQEEVLLLQEPLRIDSALSGQLTIDDSVGRGQLAGKQRITLHISAEIVDRVKNAVYWEPGLTVAGFAEEALEKALADMETERGKPFPQRRQHRLRGGRPII